MKYWVYKDSRILGPFDRAAFSGLPGVDSSTLVSVGEVAGGGEADWRLAGDIPDLAGLGLDRASWALISEGELASTQGVLDRLQIDAAGLVGDEDFPAGAEDLFQDADMKKNFGDLLAPKAATEEAELRRARDRAAELASQVDALNKRLNDLETSRAELMHRLAEQEARARMPVPPPPVAPVPPAPPAPPAAFTAPLAPVAEPSPLPSIPSLPPPAADPALPPVASGWGLPVGVPGLPSLPVPGGPPVAPPLATEIGEVVPIEEPASPAAKSKLTFGKKSFKIVPTRKTFRVVGAEEAAAASEAPAPEAAAPTPEAAAPVLPHVPPPVASAAPPPAVPELPSFAPSSLPAAPALAPADALASIGAAPVDTPLSLQPAPPPPAAPPSIAPPPSMTFAQPFATPVPVPEPANAAPLPVPVPGGGDMAGAPPATMRVSGDASPAAAPIPVPPPLVEGADPGADAVLARLAKPSAPPTAPPVPRPRSYKVFYIAGAVLVVVLAAIGFMFRNPQDVSNMASLDDGRPRLGAEEAAPDAALPPLPPPAPTAPVAPPTAPEAVQPGPGTALTEAIELVKGFPLDGDRGTVAAWLQYSYAASADAGREDWSANAKGDDLFLVEYKVEPAPGSSNPGVFFLFEADMARRLVMGKNPEARKMLAGAPPAVEEAPKPRPKAKARPKAKPRPVVEEPKEVPLLPLPGDNELRPPAEDDGAFGSDTVDTGI